MHGSNSLARVVGWAALGFSVLYFVSDVIEGLQGEFSTWQLWLTLIAEAAIPFFVIGLYVVQRPKIGKLGLIGAILYAYVYVYFTYTVIYALVKDTPDYDTLSDILGGVMFAHGVVMVIAGIAFGAAVIRARVLPSWTGWALIAGVILVAATQGAPESIQLVAAGVRAAAFAGMGLALLRPATA